MISKRHQTKRVLRNKLYKNADAAAYAAADAAATAYADAAAYAAAAAADAYADAAAAYAAAAYAAAAADAYADAYASTSRYYFWRAFVFKNVGIMISQIHVRNWIKQYDDAK